MKIGRGMIMNKAVLKYIKGKKIRSTLWSEKDWIIGDPYIETNTIKIIDASEPLRGYIGAWLSVNDPLNAELFIEDEIFTKDLTCQCGKDKHGFASHSDWCPKTKEK